MSCRKIVLHSMEVDAGKLQIIDKADLSRLAEQQKLFISYLNTGDTEAVNSMLDNYLNILQGTDIKTAQNFVINFFVTIGNKLQELGIEIENLNQAFFEYHVVLQIHDIGQLKTWCKFVLDDIIQKVEEFRETSETNVIKKAKEFINTEYSKRISLEDVANHVYLSPVYFSRLFKIKTGVNYIDYLIEVRMEKAMELLKNPKYKTYEVSSMVGYKGVKYFYKQFKKYTGLTPTEYRG